MKGYYEENIEQHQQCISALYKDLDGLLSQTAYHESVKNLETIP